LLAPREEMRTRLIYILLILITSCKGTSLETVTLTPDHKKILCNGTSNLFNHIKKSQDVKDKYRIEAIRLKTNKNLYVKLSKVTGDNLDINGLNGSDYKILSSNCDLLSDKNPEFTLIYMYLVDTKELMGSVGTIVKRNSFRTGFHFRATLTDNGELGQVKVEPFSE
jgi:hypothetical protein